MPNFNKKKRTFALANNIFNEITSSSCSQFRSKPLQMNYSHSDVDSAKILISPSLCSSWNLSIFRTYHNTIFTSLKAFLASRSASTQLALQVHQCQWWSLALTLNFSNFPTGPLFLGIPLGQILAFGSLSWKFFHQWVFQWWNHQ